MYRHPHHPRERTISPVPFPGSFITPISLEGGWAVGEIYEHVRFFLFLNEHGARTLSNKLQV
jgi:hypothetical protein